MKFKHIFLLISICAMGHFASHSQEVVQGLKQVFDITADKLGNAQVEVSMKLNAQQWDQLKKNIGNNPSILKRNMEKALPKYFLTDFSYSEDQMERISKIKFNVLGLCSINKDGIWEAKFDTKNPDILKLSDKEYVITQDLNSDGIFIQQTQKLHLPENAKNAKLEKDSFGKAVLHYSTGSSIMSTLLLILGILFIVVGGWLLLKGKKKSIVIVK